METTPSIDTLDSQRKLPQWFLGHCARFRQTEFMRDPAAAGAYVAAAEKNIYETYATFNAQTRTVYLFAFSTIAISATLIALATSQSGLIKTALLIAAAFSVASFFPLGILALKNMRGRYRAYVASVLQAAYCHYAVGVPTHPWFEWLEQYLVDADPPDAQTLIEVWINTPPNSYLPYRNSTWWFSALLAVVAAVLILAALFGVAPLGL